MQPNSQLSGVECTALPTVTPEGPVKDLMSSLGVGEKKVRSEIRSERECGVSQSKDERAGATQTTPEGRGPQHFEES